MGGQSNRVCGGVEIIILLDYLNVQRVELADIYFKYTDDYGQGNLAPQACARVSDDTARVLGQLVQCMSSFAIDDGITDMTLSGADMGREHPFLACAS